MPRYTSRLSGLGFGNRVTPAVRMLITICVVTFVLQLLEQLAGQSTFTFTFGLTPQKVLRGYVWQLVTYIFLHGGFFHLVFNMLGLWMFGSQLEQFWGRREFTRFFFICGVGAAVVTVLASPSSSIPTIGASGAIFGILLAFGLLFPNQIILLNFIIPIPAKYYVMIFGAMTLFASISGTGGGVAHITHLGGMIIGLIYLKGRPLITNLQSRYERWQRNRLRRKFEVFYNERHRDEEDQSPRWRN